MSATTPTRSPLEPHVMRVVLVVIFGIIMSALDTTIVNVALDDLGKDLHASLSDVQWVITGYLLSLAAVIPLTGWATRRFGARRLYLAALAIFTAGSALCALATNNTELVIFRVVQGIGGGMLTPVGQMMLVNAAGRENLPRVMSLIGIPVVFAPVLGPTLGGLLLESVGWQWIFLINVPIGIAAFAFGARVLPAGDPSAERAGRLDVGGLVLSAVGVVGVTYGLSSSESAGSLTASSVLIPVGVGLVSLAVYIWRSGRVERPLLDLSLFRNRGYSAAAVVSFCLGAVLFGSMILLPLYFQQVRGESAVMTGLLLGPQGLGSGVAMFVSGRLTEKIGAGVTSLIGGVILTLATLPFLFIDGHTSFVVLGFAMLVRGIGVGLALMPAMTAAFAVLNPDQVSDASPQLTVLQRVGGSLGTAIIAVVLQDRISGASRTTDGLASAFSDTYIWVIVVTVIALVPTAFLMLTERRAKQAHAPDPDAEVEIVHALAEA